MNTCKNCKYYVQITNFGDCKMVVESCNDDPRATDDEVDKIIFGVGGHYDSVWVGENFGCIHFEEKDK